LEDKSKELQRVLGEKRWIEADQQALQDQLTACRTRMDNDSKQSQSIITGLRSQLKTSTSKIDELHEKLVASESKV
jgi:predicted  nucleic acid-binding Zn-ribbon protein